MLYQSKASELLQYLISKYNNKKEQDQSKTYLLKSINEFAIFAIEKQDPHLQIPLLDFYSNQFYSYRENYHPDVGPEYPVDLCFITNEIIATSINNQNQYCPVINRTNSVDYLFVCQN